MGRRQRVSNDNKIQRWNIAIYIRLSKEDGNIVSNSIIHQKDRILAYLSEFEDDYELIDMYIDDGFSGTDSNRDGFQRMLKHISENKVNCVVVKDLSRLSRNMSEATYYIENTFVEYDVRFISLELPALDSYLYPEHMNSILVPIQNVINDDFCRQTSIKIRGVLDNKRRQGQFIGAFAPYGYKKDNKDKHCLIPDDNAAEVVRDIFHWYVRDGLSKNAIAKKLNKMGILNPTSYKRKLGLQYCNPNSTKNDSLWCSRTIHGILQNQMYLGHMVQGRYRTKSYKVHKQIRPPKNEWYVVKNTHEPLISGEIFEQAANLQERDTRTASKNEKLYLLSGFVRCADCGKAMVRSQGGSKIKYSYYQCRTYREKSKEACSKHTIRVDVLEEAVFYAIRAQIGLLISFDNMIEEIRSAQNASISDSASCRFRRVCEERGKELDKITDIKDALYEDLKDGVLAKDDYFRLRDKYNKLIHDLEKMLYELKEEQKQVNESSEVHSSYLEYFLNYRDIKELRRSTIVDLVEAIYIHEGGQVEIVFNFVDPYMSFVDMFKRSGNL